MRSKSLARLRAKTDRELAILVTQQLQRCQILASAGEYRLASELYQLATKLLMVTTPSEAAPVQSLHAQVRQLVEVRFSAIA
jgi:hypothetical protein